MIALGSKVLVLNGGTWSIGHTASFRKDNGSIDALFNGVVITLNKGNWQLLPSTMSEAQALEEAIRYNIRSLVSASVVRKYKNKPAEEDLEDLRSIVDNIFDDDPEEDYSDDCDCDSCRAHRGEEV